MGLTTQPTRLIDASRCGVDILTARFERPEGWNFSAGQWLRLTVPIGQSGQSRTLSIASAPADQWLEVTTRLSDSAFKQALAAMRPGDTATVSGPGGRFAMPADVERAVFLVGGVGITPARSILRDGVQRGRRFADALVLYGNRDPSCVPYREELESMKSSGVRVVHVFERGADTPEAESGLITAAVVSRHLVDPESSLFVVAGPPPMVVAMEVVLDELSVPRQRRMVESFGARS